MRIVHLGLGNFFRAHQAWYTSVAPESRDWPIAAFTGRSPEAARQLNAQNGRYTLLVRGPERDEAQIIGTVDTAYAANDHQAWQAHLASPRTALVTLTVTEAAYLRESGGGLAESRAAADVSAWLHGEPVRSVPGRLTAGLAERRLSRGGPIAIVPCDNLPANGEAVARVVLDFASLAEPALVPWIRDNVSFVSTMVDRITPRTTAGDLEAAASLTGFDDAMPVVTEPFTEWVLDGVFPAGRPGWEAGGARFVSDITAHEQRKLLLLNGGHSLLAYAGSARGHQTVADAVADPDCLAWLTQWWAEASRYVPLPPDEIMAYRQALLVRFSNGRIRHTLAQIAADGSQKIPIRVVPVLRGEVRAGRLPVGAIRVLASWIGHLRGAGAPVDDAGAALFVERAGNVRDLLALLAPDLATNEALVAAIEEATR
ncbi:mannitol dehydrogenase family protein [Paractinoplanes ferrugineus]|nr:mannitol dehydrogenase family protein [Actinoplanes ferrugineus]